MYFVPTYFLRNLECRREIKICKSFSICQHFKVILCSETEHVQVGPPVVFADQWCHLLYCKLSDFLQLHSTHSLFSKEQCKVFCRISNLYYLCTSGKERLAMELLYLHYLFQIEIFNFLRFIWDHYLRVIVVPDKSWKVEIFNTQCRQCPNQCLYMCSKS